MKGFGRQKTEPHVATIDIDFKKRMSCQSQQIFYMKKERHEVYLLSFFAVSFHSAHLKVEYNFFSRTFPSILLSHSHSTTMPLVTWGCFQSFDWMYYALSLSKESFFSLLSQLKYTLSFKTLCLWLEAMKLWSWRSIYPRQAINLLQSYCNFQVQIWTNLIPCWPTTGVAGAAAAEPAWMWGWKNNRKKVHSTFRPHKSARKLRAKPLLHCYQ